MSCACLPNCQGKRDPVSVGLEPKNSWQGVNVVYSSQRMYNSSVGTLLYPPVSPHQKAVLSGVFRLEAMRISATRPSHVACESPVHMPGNWSAPVDFCVWVSTKPRPRLAMAETS